MRRRVTFLLVLLIFIMIFLDDYDIFAENTCRQKLSLLGIPESMIASVDEDIVNYIYNQLNIRTKFESLCYDDIDLYTDDNSYEEAFDYNVISVKDSESFYLFICFSSKNDKFKEMDSCTISYGDDLFPNIYSGKIWWKNINDKWSDSNSKNIKADIQTTWNATYIRSNFDDASGADQLKGCFFCTGLLNESKNESKTVKGISLSYSFKKRNAFKIINIIIVSVIVGTCITIIYVLFKNRKYKNFSN